ncbi:uncharacterized protein LOC143027109 [Oratosquilla oratoria]|uniref:uncharacterized protein LOC143027109 n=1 Tax=Oratosquilla oratoria TaxID=337810 RepID=UPI003F7714AA
MQNVGVGVAVTVILAATYAVLLNVGHVRGSAVPDAFGYHHHHHGHHHHGHGVIAGLALAGGYLAGSHHHNHHSHGSCGGCGGGCGWCGGYYGRRKRGIEDFVSNSEVKETYAHIASEDKDQCGLRLVCELAQKAPQDLAEDEVQILLPYRGAGPSDGSSIYNDYDEAAWHGQLGHSCSQQYQLCGFTAAEVMKAYRKHAKDHEGIDPGEPHTHGEEVPPGKQRA